jgi:hypothetical protein
MYSVIRFLERSGNSRLEEVAKRIEAEITGQYPGRDIGVPNRISCSISSAPSWQEQRNAIVSFIEKASETIVFCRLIQIDTEVDLAIEPEDYLSRIITECSIDGELLQLLARVGISFTFTIYGCSQENMEQIMLR